jgi:hypothetical protein
MFLLLPKIPKFLISVVNDYFAVLQIKSMTSVCWHFLSVNVPLLAALSQHNIKTTTCSSTNHYKFHSEFLSAEIHEIWLLHYLKITEKFQTKGETNVISEFDEDNLSNLGSSNLQTFRWSKQNIPRIQNICAYIPLYYGRTFDNT